MYKLSQRSKDNLKGVHPDLIRVVERAIQITPYDFGINETSVRTEYRQKILVATGKSQSMNSRHIPENNECNLSCAIDINVYNKDGLTWDIGYYRRVAQAFVTAAIELGIQVELGILWKSFIDGVHIQLGRKEYP